ncbi:MAG: CIA30 family protein [Chitinispirillales bacterium]|nr:CIA30 family protein [Chitinispirillales bacterium]
MNEVHNGNWGNGATEAEQQILFDWNKAALNAIRTTGGNNATRFVAVPGLGSTEPNIVISAHNNGKLLPSDGANGTDKLIVAVHYYTPHSYTHNTSPDATWGSVAEKTNLTNDIKSLKTNFIDNGIAVYFGEWGTGTTIRKTEAAKTAVMDYVGSVAAAARANGVVPLYWDAGDFKILERTNGRPQAGLCADALAAMMNALKTTTVAGQWNWETVTDIYNSGTSTINMDETGGSYEFTGTVTDAYQYGFAGWTVTPDDNETLDNLKKATSILFKVIGDGKTYKVKLPTSDITEYNYYFVTFPTTDGVETTVTVNISDFAQPNWGTQKPLNKSLIETIQWETDDGALGAFSITIKDLVLEVGYVGGDGNTIDDTKKWVAFTFDDGPSSNTVALMNTLQEHSIKATFFTIGENISGNKAGLQRMIEDGHEIAQHSWDHPDLTELSESEIRNQLKKASDEVEGFTGSATTLVRPPYLSTNATVSKVANELGMALINCDVNSKDFEDRPFSQIITEMTAPGVVKNGSIVLFHDRSWGDYDNVRLAIPEIARILREQGFEFTTVRDLANRRNRSIEPGVVYSHFYEEGSPAASVYTVTVTNDGHGKAKTTSALATDGTPITLAPTPDNGYVFKEWQVLHGGIAVADNKFTMPASNVVVKAIFEPSAPNAIKDVKKSGGRGIKIIPGSIVSQSAEIAVVLPDDERVAEVKAVIYDNIGNVVFERTERGDKVLWNLTNSAGRGVANGSYLVFVEVKGFKGTVKTYSAKLGVKR